jgi:uncharacterized protein YyaL (SSP411 family)
MSNRLIHEQSPYLLQHAHNPVDWFPWGDEAFEMARQHHKPLLVSIGYAACHWCHVMERESFENTAVAAFMNEHFVCVKVDREEHPDVDHLYMDAVQAMSGSGGWPLNVFVTPDRIPFYGGTYYPPSAAFNRPSWTEVLERLNDIWTNRQDEVVQQSEQMLAYLKNASAVAIQEGHVWNKEACDKMLNALLAMADTKFGGFGGAPKFLGTMAINFLLEQYHFYGNEAALQQALLSLDSMIRGGLYDQLGGGFARYSTDKYWLAPHFEKMLYDNALLVRSLCNAYQLTGQPLYRKIITETLAFITRELQHESGGFFSALDADSEGVEGKFYTFTWAEWLAVFPDGNPVASAYFGIEKDGNWEHTNILHIAGDITAIATENNLTEEQVITHIEATKKTLYTVREKRIRPHTDDKCLLSWNALMNMALTSAGIALQDNDYLDKATQHMEWMMATFSMENGLQHTWKNGRSRIIAKLDDCAYLIQAMLLLGSATDHNKWIEKAASLMQFSITHFSDEKDLFFFFTSDEQTDIPVRKIDIYDGATPSANAVMAHNLLLLGLVMENSVWRGRGEHMLQAISATAVRYPYSFGYWATLLQQFLTGFKTVVITGDPVGKYSADLKTYFLPGIFTIADQADEKKLPVQKDKLFSQEVRLYVCTAYECKPPESSIVGVLKHL